MREARVPRLLVQRRRLLDELVPARGRLHVHFDDAGIRRDEEMRQPRIVRRRIAFEQHAHAERARRRFDGRDQIEIVLERRDRRHEDVQDAAARLDAQRRADDAGGRLDRAMAAIGARRRRPSPVPTVLPAIRHAVMPGCGCGDWRSRRACAASGARGANGSSSSTSSRSPARRPTAANRAAGEAPSANRRESDTAARRAGTRARSSSVRPRPPVAPKRQRVADDRRRDPGVKTRRRRVALQFVVETRVERIDVDRQLPLAPEVVPDVFVAGLHVRRSVTSELRGERGR